MEAVMFSTPELVLWDSLRIIAALASLMVTLMTPWIVMTQTMVWHQRLRFVGAALVGAAIVGAYLQALGTVPASWWRTILITAGMVMMAAGWLAHLRATVPITQSPHRHRR